MKPGNVKKQLRKAYKKIVEEGSSCCPSLCATDISAFSQQLGYTAEELESVPEGANLALGCGNPTALASLQKGETVLDLGSGAGIDCFIASEKVGASGWVIGVDMTPEMVQRARENARKAGITNVEFRLGDIENLPVADNSVDVVISNCVINLVTNKSRVFSEVYRVLKPGGRIAFSDLGLNKALPQALRESIEAYIGCISGALMVDKYQRTIEAHGFTNVSVMEKPYVDFEAPDTCDPLSNAILESLQPGKSVSDYVVNVEVSACKPG